MPNPSLFLGVVTVIKLNYTFQNYFNACTYKYLYELENTVLFSEFNAIFK